jgi:hypothetical protein
MQAPVRSQLRASLSPLRSLLAPPQWPDCDFTGGPLTHELVIPDGPDGRPGERLLSASRSFYTPRVLADDSREDFRVMLDEHRSTLAAVCLRRIERPEQIEESAWHTLKRAIDGRFEGDYILTPTRIAGETAYGYSVVLRIGVLNEWKLAHAGWLYVVGVLNRAPAREREATIQRALDALDTWTWLPAAANA